MAIDIQPGPSSATLEARIAVLEELFVRLAQAGATESILDNGFKTISERLETIAQQMMQQHDQMSRRTTQAMLDVARVLTPEQRGRIAERMRDHQAQMEDRMQRMRERMGGDSATSPRR